jgi:hypothetical protein
LWQDAQLDWNKALPSWAEEDLLKATKDNIKRQ